MILPIYKPVGPTSFNIISQIKKITGIKKIGHAGTLDPLAEGVLVVGIGRESTKKLFIELEKEKEYEVLIELGKISTTDDSEGEKTVWKVPKVPRVPHVSQALKKFIGEIWQMPPQYSAVKRGGMEAYKNARKGKQTILGKRQVLVKDIQILNYKWPFLTLKVTTGPGVYIRSLARELGEELKTGGYVKQLKRTRVGEFKIEDCFTPDSLKDMNFDTM
ncbi:tRNA pseudouridine(55) synthase TruB [Candidatus Daviesbacteria bacterium]|nr:tRNA pseudouridine(55) synthase TruB [Candidatus Daviesbacteria bacterium]